MSEHQGDADKLIQATNRLTDSNDRVSELLEKFLLSDPNAIIKKTSLRTAIYVGGVVFFTIVLYIQIATVCVGRGGLCNVVAPGSAVEEPTEQTE